jgi:hypothetical protein
MTRDRLRPDADRLLVARLDGIAKRHARWGGLTEDEKSAGAAELREVTGGRGDVLAETDGLALGTAESKGDEFRVRGQATAELCRLAGADEHLIPQWTEEGGRRAEAAKLPFSRPGRGCTIRAVVPGSVVGQPSERVREQFRLLSEDAHRERQRSRHVAFCGGHRRLQRVRGQERRLRLDKCRQPGHAHIGWQARLRLHQRSELPYIVLKPAAVVVPAHRHFLPSPG